VQYFPQLDQLKVLHMALLHDFGEIYAGDITPADNITASEKYKCEWSAVQQIFGALANGQYFIDLWLEYEQGKSAESQLVRQLDRLEMALQANIYERRGWLDPQAFYHSAQQAMVWDEIKFIFEQVRGLQTTTNG
jgi:putative hydrolase of HD superfamily